MTQIPILSGIYSDSAADFRTSMPINLVPVPKAQGISNGYLRPADGLVQVATGPGLDRGGINWRGVHYRVMGTNLVSVSSAGVVTVLGDVGNDGTPATLDYGFDYLAIASAGSLFYWDENTLTQVTDADLGTVNDVLWVDGYYMTTDGEFLVVTDLNDPFAVNPLKYGSSEADPDPILAILKIRNEVAALNRHTIEFFDNVGGQLFPFQRIEGAQIEKGCVGKDACCIYLDAIAFLGSGFNEAPGVYIGANGSAPKISTREVDTLLLAYTEDELALAVMEARNDKANQLLYIHLPDRTLVYDAAATQAVGEPAWHVLTTGLEGFNRYPARGFVWVHDGWYAGNPASNVVCRTDDTISSHYGAEVRWEFATGIVYNASAGAVFHSMELIGLPGRVAFGDAPYIETSYSFDGVEWSQGRTISAGTQGQRQKRLAWFQQGSMRNWRVQRFRGTSDAFMSFARLEARLEPLAW